MPIFLRDLRILIPSICLLTVILIALITIILYDSFSSDEPPEQPIVAESTEEIGDKIVDPKPESAYDRISGVIC